VHRGQVGLASVLGTLIRRPRSSRTPSNSPSSLPLPPRGQFAACARLPQTVMAKRALSPAQMFQGGAARAAKLRYAIIFWSGIEIE